jgi:hypothetical protein
VTQRDPKSESNGVYLVTIDIIKLFVRGLSSEMADNGAVRMLFAVLVKFGRHGTCRQPGVIRNHSARNQLANHVIIFVEPTDEQHL